MSDDDEHPRVLISNRQPRPVDQEGLRGLARRVLVGEGAARAELSVSLVTEEEMAALHERYLAEPGPTDVLAFPLDAEEGGVRVLGDVVIAPSVAARNNPDLDAELRLLLVHGILHLLGYDHEEEGGRAEMWARQEAYSGVRP